MSDLLTQVNQALAEESPALARCLSGLGRRVFLPRGIPVQAQEARGKTYNGTIGLVTDGHGGAVPLPSMAAALAPLPAADRTPAFLYSPVTGIPELRQRWRGWQRHTLPTALAEVPSSLPVVTCGLSHSLSILADLFGGEDRTVIIPGPYWGNYNHVFTTRTGARVLAADAYRNRRFNPLAFEEAVAQDSLLGPEDPILAVVNWPSNPGGYSPTDEERSLLRDSLHRLADRRPVIAVCDDAYAGLVYETHISRRSLFWDLIGLHEQLIPIKVDGATKEFSFFGGRVGFLTFPFAAESAAAKALESKVGGLTRSTVGSPVASSQMILLQALRREDVATEVESIRLLLEGRYRQLKPALEAADGDLLEALPFNSGCFALVRLVSDDITAEDVRLHLLAEHDTGLCSVGDRFVRIAHCSVAAEMLPELVRRLEMGVAELARPARTASSKAAG
jgi:aspartate/methionine/tyrosine aminotransferase